jgi:mevalonate kinase
VILLGEHAVNRRQPAIAAAVTLRAHVAVSRAAGGAYRLRSGSRSERIGRAQAHAFAARVDAMRAKSALDEIAAVAARDFFAPLRYLLALVDARIGLPPVEATVESEIPIGAGLGSGAAVASALALAVAAVAGTSLDRDAITELAWAADTIAHGGVASALDASASTLGGVVRYELDRGGRRLASPETLTLVIGDTGIAASTAAVNGHVRDRLTAEPTLSSVFEDIGLLVDEAASAIEAGDLERLGNLMNLNQLALARIGVSSNELDALVAAALGAGALGAKLSGSGGGGIVVALSEPTRSAAVANAIEGAGGRAFVATVADAGAEIDAVPSLTRP